VDNTSTPSVSVVLRRRGVPVLLALLVAGTACGISTPRAAAPVAAEVHKTAEPTPSAASRPAQAAPPVVVTAQQAIDAAPATSALALLGTLAVKGRAPKTGYAREQFGPAWTDTDRNGCDTRNDVLTRDLSGRTYRAGTHDCVVLSGTLHDPYTARVITFAKAQATAVQIDHVVALSDSWQTGSFAWPAGKRLALANDPLNLLAVDGPTNEAKSDSDAASWLPPSKAYRCSYVARQVSVKAKYRLWVTAAERDAVARVLSSCPQQPAPAGGNPTLAPVRVPTTHAPATQPPAAAPATSGLDPDYGTCKNTKAHGAGPYYRGKDPEYDWYRDADSDGIVCE
jgi:hypothetical protein